MEINIDDLIMIIGQQTVRINMLERAIATMQQNTMENPSSSNTDEKTKTTKK